MIHALAAAAGSTNVAVSRIDVDLQLAIPTNPQFYMPTSFHTDHQRQGTSDNKISSTDLPNDKSLVDPCAGC